MVLLNLKKSNCILGGCYQRQGTKFMRLCLEIWAKLSEAERSWAKLNWLASSISAKVNLSVLRSDDKSTLQGPLAPSQPLQINTYCIKKLTIFFCQILFLHYFSQSSTMCHVCKSLFLNSLFLYAILYSVLLILCATKVAICLNKS